MLRNEDVVAILGREAAAGVEAHTERYVVATRVARAELRIRNVAGMAERIAEMRVGRGDAVEFVVGYVVAHHVAAVVGEPQLVRLRMPVKADRVADASRDQFQITAISVHAHQVGVTVFIRAADVAGCAHWHVQLAIGAEGDEFPAVMRLCGQLVVDDYGLRRVVETLVDAIEPYDARHGRHIQAAVTPGHPHRQLQAGSHHMHWRARFLQRHRVDFARAAAHI